MEFRILGPLGVGKKAARFPSAGADPEISLEQTEVEEALVEAIPELPEREKLVVTLYELTPREIGEVLGVTESRVSELHTKAILRLRAHLSGAAPREPAET